MLGCTRKDFLVVDHHKRRRKIARCQKIQTAAKSHAGGTKFFRINEELLRIYSMVELSEGTYDYDDIPFASASVVSIDAELSDDHIVTAHVIPPLPDIAITSSQNRLSGSRESPILGYESSFSTISPYFNNDSGSEGDGLHDERPDGVRDRQRMVGAGTAGAVLGLLVGGPVLSLVFGIGSAYYTKQEGATGDVARALGDVALVARDKWKEVDSKHHIVNRSREATNEAIHHIQEADRRHHGRQRLFKFVAYCWRKTWKFIEDHRLIDRGCYQLKVLADHVAIKIRERHHHSHFVQGCNCHYDTASVRRDCSGYGRRHP